MPKAYIVANIHPTGAASPPPEYFEGFRRVLAKHAGKRIIASNDIDYREGKLGIGRLLVIEFADKPTAVACYEEYAKDVVPLNPSKFKRELFIVEGAD
jgi:uncharacterized protein (DUF1330 family)